MTNNHEAFSIMPTEYESTEYEAKCIAPEGLGFGEGSISAHEVLTSEQLATATELLIAHKDRIIRPVEEYDDGCGDGRPTDIVFQVIDGQTDEIREYKKSKLRAKIFGGGLQVAASMWRSVAGRPESEETVLGDRKFIAAKLSERDIQFGAHTDTHAEGDACGCGAIDKYASSVTIGVSEEYAEQIVAAASALDSTVSEDSLRAAQQTRHFISADEHYMSDAAGSLTMDFIMDSGAVVKRLREGHREALLFANDEPGTTVDQSVITELFKEAELPDNVHVFVIDVWRGKMYADVVGTIAHDVLGVDASQAADVAYADFLVNQLAVATTLTKGDIPVIYNAKKTA